MVYVNSLKFEQKPDYKFLKALFEDTYIEMGFAMMINLNGIFKRKEPSLKKRKKRKKKKKEKD